MNAVRDYNFDQMVVYHFNLPIGNILFMGNTIMSGVEGSQNLGLFYGTYSLWSERDLYCSTPVGTRRQGDVCSSSKGPTHLVAFYVMSKMHWGTILTRVSTRVAFLNVETSVIMLAKKVWLMHINVTWRCYLNDLYLFI